MQYCTDSLRRGADRRLSADAPKTVRATSLRAVIFRNANPDSPPPSRRPPERPRCGGYRCACVMNDARKTKAQLIEELDELRGENTDLREKVAGVDVSGVERQLAVERVRAAGYPLG